MLDYVIELLRFLGRSDREFFRYDDVSVYVSMNDVTVLIPSDGTLDPHQAMLFRMPEYLKEKIWGHIGRYEARDRKIQEYYLLRIVFLL